MSKLLETRSTLRESPVLSRSKSLPPSDPLIADPENAPMLGGVEGIYYGSLGRAS